MDSFKKSVISGDMSKIYGNSKYVLAVYSEYTTLNVGDKVKIGDEELEIGCVVSEGVGSVVVQQLWYVRKKLIRA